MLSTLCRLIALAQLAVVGAAAASTHKLRANAPTVTLDNATVIGFTENSVTSYLGIPFAQPPVGDLRLRLPRAIGPYNGTLDGTKPSGQCMQLQATIRPDLPPKMKQDVDNSFSGTRRYRFWTTIDSDANHEQAHCTDVVPALAAWNELTDYVIQFAVTQDPNGDRTRPFRAEIRYYRPIPYTMVQFFNFFEIFGLFYSKLGVIFASGYLAGFVCAVGSLPADSLGSLVSLMGKRATMGKTLGAIASETGIVNLATKGLGTRVLMIGTLR